MDSNTLNSRFKEVSEQIKKAVADDPALSAMFGVLMVLFESQSSEITQLTNRIAELTLTIERLSAKLGNKSITVRKTTNENINGKGSERKKGIDSSSKEKKQKEKKEVPVNDDVSVTDKEVCIDIDGKELSLEEAKKKVGTVFTGKDGVHSIKDFLNNPQAQENAQVVFKKKHRIRLSKEGFIYILQSIFCNLSFHAIDNL